MSRTREIKERGVRGALVELAVSRTREFKERGIRGALVELAVARSVAQAPM